MDYVLQTRGTTSNVEHFIINQLHSIEVHQLPSRYWQLLLRLQNCTALRSRIMNALVLIWTILIAISATHVSALSCLRSLSLGRRINLTSLRAIGNILTPEEFESITTKSSSSVPCVIDFQKSECKPCKKIAPDYEALSIKYTGKVNFFKIDADTSKEALALMKANGIKSVPTFHIWVAGNKIDTVQGAHLDEVEETLILELNKQT